MAIKELISLEGVDQVEAGLKRVNTAGEESLKKFNELGSATGEGGGPFDALVKNAQAAGLELDKSTGSTKQFTEALHILRPVLQELGVNFANIRELSALARIGFEGLAVAIAAAAAVGLGKLEEDAARTRGVLDDLFKAGGPQAFAALQNSAKQFGTTVDGLLPGLEAFQTALNNVDRTAKGFVALKAENLPTIIAPPDVKAVTDAYDNFIKILRAGRLTQDEAQKSAKAFFDTLKDGGVVTKASLQNLPTGAVQLLKDAFGAAGLTTQAFFEQIDAGGLTIDKLTRALANFGPQADKAFDAKSIKTMGEEFQKLLNTISRGIVGKEFSDAIIAGLDSITGAIQRTIDRYNELGQKVADAIAKAKLAGDIFVGPTLEQAGPAGAFVKGFTGPTLEQAGKAGEDAGGAFNQGFLKRGFVFPPAVGEEAGAKFVADVQKGFKDNPFTPDAAKEVVQPLADAIPKTIEDKVAEAGNELAATGLGIDQGIQADIERGIPRIQAFYDFIKNLFAQPIPINFETNPFLSGQPTNLATGGQISGPGSGTSDSIMAFLSNREWVINTRAVDFYGSGFFAALNSMSLPRDFASRFSMGALAKSLGPHFAQGGQASSSTPVNLFIGGDRFGVQASEETVSRLRRVAVRSQLASGGRAPGWVK